jgi:hypothetical protein
MARCGPPNDMKNPPLANRWRREGEYKAGFSGERFGQRAKANGHGTSLLAACFVRFGKHFPRPQLQTEPRPQGSGAVQTKPLGRILALVEDLPERRGPLFLELYVLL